MKPFIFHSFILVLTIVALSSCGSNIDSEQKTGSLALALTWTHDTTSLKGKTLEAATPDVCADYGINTINARILNGSSVQVATGSAACTAHSMTIGNIPAGTVNIEVTGVTTTNDWVGQATGVVITAGQVTSLNGNPIVMTYVGNDFIPPEVSTGAGVVKQGSTNVALDTPIYIIFNEPFALSSVNENTFFVSDGTSTLAGTYTYNNPANSAILTLTSGLTASALHTVTVTTGATDRAGNHLAASYSFTFTTGSTFWNRQFGTSTGDKARSVATDTAGNIYVAGNLGDSAGSPLDLFVTKYDSLGNHAWTKQVDMTASDSGYGVAADANGNIFVAGETGGVVVLIKYDTLGNQLWSRQTASAANCTGVATDASGNAYISGYAWGNFDGNHVTNFASDVILIKYDSSGTMQWAKQVGSGNINSYEMAFSVATTSNGNIYLAGHTDGNMDSQPTNTTNHLLVMKYDSAGNNLWTRQLGGIGPANEFMGKGISVDSSGNAFITGQTNALGPDIFVVKYDASGNWQWTQKLGVGSGSDSAYGISVDSNSNAYLAGFTTGNLDGMHAGNSTTDIVVAKYDTGGNLLWTKQFGSSGSTAAYAFGIALDPIGTNIYVAGFTNGDLGASNAGMDDVVLVKLGQ